MRQFTETAIVHAQDQHGVELRIDAEGLAAVDRILDHQRLQGDPRDRDALALCYGSWIGDFACSLFGAERVKWIGMQEPEPPRLEVAGIVCSPIEAVARRLNSDAEPTVEQRIAEMRSWVEARRQVEYDRAHNREAWNRLVGDPRFTSTNNRKLDHAAAEAAIDPWLREKSLSGQRVLCLASGGGTHGPLYAAAGACVTVVDISEAALEVDRRMAAEHDLPLKTLRASMDALDGLDDQSFDAVIHPVSTCYLPDVNPVYAEVARVVVEGGLYVVQHKQPASLQASGCTEDGGYRIVHPAFAGQPVDHDDTEGAEHLEAGTKEFVHPLGELLGGLCRAGFVIEDVQEPPRADRWAAAGSRQNRACFLPPYLKIKARRVK